MLSTGWKLEVKKGNTAKGCWELSGEVVMFSDFDFLLKNLSLIWSAL